LHTPVLASVLEIFEPGAICHYTISQSVLLHQELPTYFASIVTTFEWSRTPEIFKIGIGTREELQQRK